jgi:hypothetical protein
MADLYFGRGTAGGVEIRKGTDVLSTLVEKNLEFRPREPLKLTSYLRPPFLGVRLPTVGQR